MQSRSTVREAVAGTAKPDPPQTITLAELEEFVRFGAVNSFLVAPYGDGVCLRVELNSGAGYKAGVRTVAITGQPTRLRMWIDPSRLLARLNALSPATPVHVSSNR